jgi:xanthine dehydrogenase/oxidase
MERVDSSAHGIYVASDIGFDRVASRGTPYNYFTFGAAFAHAFLCEALIYIPGGVK